MKRHFLSLDRFRFSSSCQVISLVLCATLLFPGFAVAARRANIISRPSQLNYQIGSLPASPTPTPADGIRRNTPGPYVPPALRTDNAGRRANGQKGELVDAPPVKQGAPLTNLPDLSRSPTKDKSSPTQTLTTSSFKGTRETSDSDPEEMPCADCNPGGDGGAGGSDPFFGTARTRLENQTGDPDVTLGSRNFNWSAPLVSLPGRAGLDVGISLFYNSLVWTKQGTSIEFNADHGTPAPGFQLGLPRLQAEFFDSDDNSNAYLMVTPSGGRIEMKRVGSTNTYESADGTFTELTFSGSTPVVRTSDGTQYIFGTQVSAEWRCTRIEDRNGNFISAVYDSSTGHVQTITDTLDRHLTFNYDTNNNLSTITQPWGNITHTWARFDYTPVPMSFNFSNLTAVGVTNNTNVTMLSFITFPDGSSYHFDYNSYGQVDSIRHNAPDHELERTLYTINTSGTQTDCPRVTERRDSAQDWNNSQEAVTTYAITENATWTNPETSASETGTLVQQTAPDGSVYKEYSHASGWDSGLTRLSESWSGGVKKKWISTTWTQDNTSLTFPHNPRVIEMNVYDDGSNRKRTTIAYSSSYNLPIEVREWIGTNANVLYRLTTTAYNLDAQYVTRRIIGLVDNTQVTDGNGALFSKVSYAYDWDFSGDMFVDTPAAATQHDRTNYGPSFIVGRGNLSQVGRWDVNDAQNPNKIVQTKYRVNSTGSVVMVRDQLGHETSYDYADSFSDNSNHYSFAYPTKVTDPENFFSTAQYNYDFGALSRTHVPTSGTGQNINYLDMLRQYDDAGRIERITNQTNFAYTRFEYDEDANVVHSYQSVLDLTTANEFHTVQIFDGAGRVRATVSDHPGSANGRQGQYVVYNNMGRVIEQSNPTEFTVSQNQWIAAGDDQGGWASTLQSYDWKGRPLQTTNPDGTTRVVTYGGCGCAGGEVTTVQDEHGRQRRYTQDTFGRLAKVEEMNWNAGTVYATTLYDYNVRDQIKEINQAGQTRTFVYDGHGRLQTRTTPEQGATNYSYNADDTINVMTDARNVTTTYGYNSRHLVTQLAYNVTGDPTGNTAATATVNFAYDAAGNRTSMSDGLGSAAYSYNNLGQMESETRTLTGLNPTYSLSYEYNLAGELKKVTNHWNAQVSYAYDKAGRLQSVGGAGYAGVSNYASSLSYRAFGAIKGMSYGDTTSLSTTYDNLMRPTKWDVSNVQGYNYHYDDYFHERTGRVTYAQSIYDSSLDRSYEYDLVGRLAISHSGAEARAHVINGQWGTMDGPYSQGYDYDVWGNVTHKYGWGGEVQGGGAGQSSDIYYSYSGNRRNGSTYDAAGNVINDGTQTFVYDATNQQTSASGLSGSAPTFTDDPLNPNGQNTTIKLIHLTELRAAVNQLRARAALAAAIWTTDPNPQQNVTAVHHNHIQQLRAKLEEALTALHLPIGTYAHSGPNTGDTIYAADFQELRDKIKGAWTALAAAAVTEGYDGNGLRLKKVEYGANTWYLRSSVLGGQVIAELDASGTWQRGYVYAGGNLMAVQQSSAVYWMHEDPVTKSKRTTDVNGNIVSAIELDPWGADTNRSGNSAFQPKKFTSYERDSNGSDEAMFRRYNRKHSRFDQADPYEGSYSLTDPQSFNRYSYVQNDPVINTDPTGLFCPAGGCEPSPEPQADYSVLWELFWGRMGRRLEQPDVVVGGDPQNPADAIAQAGSRLSGNCLKFFQELSGISDASWVHSHLENYLNDNMSFGGTYLDENTLQPTVFKSEGIGAMTLSIQIGAQRYPGDAITFFNASASIFTGKFTASDTGRVVPFMGQISSKSSLSGLSLPQIQQLAVLHELAHAFDTRGIWDDQNDLVRVAALNRAIRKACF